jgi:hypothetical protein
MKKAISAAPARLKRQVSPGVPHVLSEAMFGLGPHQFLPISCRILSAPLVSALP